MIAFLPPTYLYLSADRRESAHVDLLGARPHASAGHGADAASREKSAWCHGMASWEPGFCPQGRSGAAHSERVNCQTNSVGYWRAVLSAADCAFRCAACVPCRLVSYSPKDDTCSWHWEQSSCSNGELQHAGLWGTRARPSIPVVLFTRRLLQQALATARPT